MRRARAALLLAAALASGCADAGANGGGTTAEADSASGTPETSGMPPEMSSPPPEARLFPEVFSVSDATVLDGDWYILDRRAHRVHRISPDGRLQSFGGEGSGPGEFRRPAAIVARGDSIILVASGILHVFSSSGEHLADRRFGAGPTMDCIGMTVRGADAVSVRAGLLLLVKCARPGEGTSTHVAIETVDGALRSLARQDEEVGTLDLASAEPVLARHPRGFLFGSGWDGCLNLFSESGERLDVLCHDWLDRLDIPPEVAREIEELAAGVRAQGIRVRMPEYMAALTGVSVMPGGQLVFKVYESVGLETEILRLVTRGEAGRAVALPVPPASILFHEGTSALAAWEELDGTRIYIRNLDEPGGA